jgi:hypothetical protein
MRTALLTLGLLSGACAAFGYDFDEYQAADAHGSGGTTTAGARSRSTDLEPDAGGERSTKVAGITAAAGATEPEEPAAGGAGAASAGAAGELCVGGAGAVTTSCATTSCSDTGAQCGSRDDGCGKLLDCGPCFWWFETCQDNLCVILYNPSE